RPKNSMPNWCSSSEIRRLAADSVICMRSAAFDRLRLSTACRSKASEVRSGSTSELVRIRQLYHVQARIGALDAGIRKMRIAQPEPVVGGDQEAQAQVVAELERGTDFLVG